MKYKNENRHWIEDKTRTARTRIGTEDKGRHANIRCKFKVSGGGKKRKRKRLSEGTTIQEGRRIG